MLAVLNFKKHYIIAWLIPCFIWLADISDASTSAAPQGINTFSLSPPFLFSFSFPALFANWLRSSVVSVLFSLISESFLRETHWLFPFLDLVTNLCACARWSHSVIGLTLPSIDANSLFHQLHRLVRSLGEEVVFLNMMLFRDVYLSLFRKRSSVFPSKLWLALNTLVM